jgi:hypothetical protein
MSVGWLFFFALSYGMLMLALPIMDDRKGDEIKRR